MIGYLRYRLQQNLPDELIFSTIEDFKRNPGNGEITIIGKKRTAIKLFVPDMIFDRHIEMGENVWLYVGETYPAYCLY